MGLTNIQWTDYSFSGWLGCRKVAPECQHCYITSTPPYRFRGITHGPERIRTAVSTWKNPISWNRKAENDGKIKRVFCASLSDWLDDENIPIEWLCDLLSLVRKTPWLTWQMLTKRPKNWRIRIESCLKHIEGKSGWDKINEDPGDLELRNWLFNWFVLRQPPENVWFGVSAGADQAAALAVPAKVHFLSCEPMLHAMDETHAKGFKWIVFGGESGKKARQIDLRWIRAGLKFCRENGIAPFVKQLGGNLSDLDLEQCSQATGLSMHDSHGGNMDEWPYDLRVREFPNEELP